MTQRGPGVANADTPTRDPLADTVRDNRQHGSAPDEPTETIQNTTNTTNTTKAAPSHAAPRDDIDAIKAITADDTVTADALAATAFASRDRQNISNSPKTLDSSDSPTTLRRGDVLGRFAILDLLGAGGMGVVVSAYDPNLDRRVAIKLMRAEHSRAATATEGQRRLLREAQAMAKLSHPNVITVYEVGEVDGGVFIAMEYVAGQTLTEWLLERERPWREVVDVFAQAGYGLAAAHFAGLVHRDFKPDNVLIGRDGRVSVTDFGLANIHAAPDVEGREVASGSQPEIDVPGALAGAALDVSKTLTRTGALMGTPRYMSPEQHRGVATDHRSDQFSFCVALYQALYGQPPFPGENYFQIMNSVLNEPVKEPPRDSPVPRRIRDAVLRGLEIEPDARHPSMRDLLAQLRAEPARARRRTLTSLASIAAVAAATLVLVYALGGLDRGEPPCASAGDKLDQVWNDDVRDRARAAFVATGQPYAADVADRALAAVDDYGARWRAMRADACAATHQRREQSASLMDLRMRCLDRRLDELGALAGVWLEHMDSGVLEGAVERSLALTDLAGCADAEALEQAYPPPAEAEVRARVDELFAQLAQIHELREAARLTDADTALSAIEAEIESLDHPPLSMRALALRAQLVSAQAPRDGLPLWERALRAAGRARDTEQLARVGIALANHRNHLGDRDAAEALLPLIEAWIAHAGDDPALRSSALELRGTLADAAGRYGEALAHFERALAALGDDAQDSMRASALRLQIASALDDLGEYQRALEETDRARELYEDDLGKDHPRVVTILRQQAIVADRLGHYDKAAALLEDGLERLRRAVSNDRDFEDYSVQLRVSLAIVKNNQGKHDEAIAIQEDILNARRRMLGPDHPAIATSLSNLANTYSDAKRHDDAIALQRQALDIRERHYGPQHPTVADSLNNLAVALKRAGRADEAMPFYQRALAIREATLAPDHPSLASALNNIAIIHHDNERYAEAAPLFARALAIWRDKLGRHPQVAVTLLYYGSSLNELKRYREAHEQLAACEEMARALHGPDHIITLYAATENARALVEIDQPERALPTLEQSLVVFRAHKSNPGQFADVQFLLARALWDAKAGRDRKRSRALARGARDVFKKLAKDGDKSARELLAEIEAWRRTHR